MGISKKFDIKIEAPFLKAERVRPNRNLQTTQRINYHTAMASPATNERMIQNDIRWFYAQITHSMERSSPLKKYKYVSV